MGGSLSPGSPFMADGLMALRFPELLLCTRYLPTCRSRNMAQISCIDCGCAAITCAQNCSSSCARCVCAELGELDGPSDGLGRQITGPRTTSQKLPAQTQQHRLRPDGLCSLKAASSTCAVSLAMAASDAVWVVAPESRLGVAKTGVMEWEKRKVSVV